MQRASSNKTTTTTTTTVSMANTTTATATSGPASGGGGGGEMKCDKKMCSAASAPRAHFRIDWRQLTYYQKDSRSLMGELFASKRTKVQQVAELEDGASSISDHAIGGGGGGRKRILNSLDGCFKSGELNAILGPSGAGKSTFLSALFGNKQEASFGQTKVTWLTGPNRSASDRAANEVKAKVVDKRRTIRIAILPQHDHLLNHLTVYETLLFASKIKNPHQASNKQFHRSNVRRVAKMLKLTECFETRCGRLSGGQYKRVSIGQELLSEPDVIILDEPTSGLDASTCLTTIKTLKSIVTKHPISIILTIHQPDIDVFNLFDQVYVIAQGGMAIYEGPPQDIVPTLAQVNLFMPHEAYNPARFIVENAFVADLDSAGETSTTTTGAALATNISGLPAASPRKRASNIALSSSEESDEEDEEDEEDAKLEAAMDRKQSNLISRSISSLTEALSGKHVDLRPTGELKAAARQFRDSGRRPLLNIGIQTAEGKLITSELLLEKQQLQLSELRAKEHLSRLNLLKRLNQLQREKYYRIPSASSDAGAHHHDTPASIEGLESTLPNGAGAAAAANQPGRPRSGLSQAITLSQASEPHQSGGSSASSSAASIASSSYSEARETVHENHRGEGRTARGQRDCSSNGSTLFSRSDDLDELAIRMNFLDGDNKPLANDDDQDGDNQLDGHSHWAGRKLRRKFDKRLSAKHSQSKRSNYPIWYHSFLLAHRTWLSIVRDPIFFGIQFTMHTTIPILLALIFGNQQEEGCPQVGNFDLVEFAYAPNQADFIHSTMRSIRQSVGNIGIIFFEMFVLSFAINCITALVFPLDMYVLLKEYRNGWYSLRSYFFGRTLADLPVPIVLHSMAMAILYYLTGQPFTWWRFWSVIGIVILASLVAQSVGLTIGALLMRSSQSAVLAAAGIVAPFFALSGFIVRIHTLPWVAQFFAKSSYLYHLLNGFIILRYGFDRCQCKEEDFELAEAHKIPNNLKTMASMWIGTYSNEYANNELPLTAQSPEHLLAGIQSNRTNVDPNIDIIDKLLGAFKMASSFGHKVETCADVMPYAMLDFNLKDSDILSCCLALLLMLIVSRLITFSAIYYKIRSFS